MAEAAKGGIDASIPLNANRPVPTPYNALTSYGQVAQTGNALLQARQLQMQVAGRNALQQAYQGVPIDPATGLPDSRALIANLQQTPGGGLVLPTVIQGLQEQQKRQYELNALQQTQTTSRTNTVDGALNPLMRMGANITPQDIFGTISGLHASGFPTDELVNDAATTLPTRQPGMSDAQYGAQLQSWVVNHASRSWSPDTQASNFTPKPGTVETGGQVVTRDTNPYTNPGIVTAAPITRTLSPGEQSDQVKGPPGSGGAPTVIPRAGYAQQNGMGNLVPGSPPASPFANGGRFPSALLNPNRPAGAAVPGASAAPGVGNGYLPNPPAPTGGQLPPGAAAPGTGGQPGFNPPTPNYVPPGGQGTPGMPTPAQPPVPGSPMPVGLPPGQQAGLDAAGKASADQWAAQQQLVGGSAGRIYQLRSALGDLQALGPTGTGPSAGTVNTVKSYMQSLPIVGSMVGFDPNQIANYDTANKYLQAYASARAGAHGGTTDSQLATTLSSNASTHISNLAAINVVKANLGLERMDQAQIAGFQNGLDPATGLPTGQHPTPDQYSDYSARFNSSMDPRAFIADQLSPQQFGATVSTMQPNERAQFQHTFNTAIQNGWIEKPSWMTPAPASTAPPSTAAPPPAAASPTAVPIAAPPPPAASPSSPAALPLSFNGNGLPAVVGGY